MTEHLPSLLELQRTDQLLDEIAQRRTPSPDDSVLALLVAFADGVDEAPLPATSLPEMVVSATRVPAVPEQRLTHATTGGRRSRRGSRHLAAALAIGLTLSSSGIAAAVTGDPLLPIKTVVRHLYGVSHEPSPDSPWILGGPDRGSADQRDQASLLPPSLREPLGLHVPNSKHPHRLGPAALARTATVHAPRLHGEGAGPPLAPPGQEGSVGTPTALPANDGGETEVPGEDPNVERPDPTSGGGTDTPPTDPPPCTDELPAPADVPNNPCDPNEPTDEPTDEPTNTPTDDPADQPGDEPADEPTEDPADTGGPEAGGDTNTGARHALRWLTPDAPFGG